MRAPPLFRAAALLLLLALAGLCDAKTLRWSSQADYLTADPQAYNEGLTNSINGQVYEGLVARGKQLEIVPRLATSWKQVGPTVWMFNLRKGVKWHDGSSFTADDVVFSVKRAQTPPSPFRAYVNTLGEPRKIDDYTVEFTTPEPNPVVLDVLSSYLLIVNKAWCVKNRAEKAQDFVNKEESHTARNAMGTGPFILVSRDPDVKSTFKKNPNWWGIKEDLFEGNVDVILYTPLKSDGTRMAALLSGEVDFILDPPVQDIEKLKQNRDVKVYEGRENRVIYLGMDQARDELLYSNVKGRNPFKDKRVRKAFYQAIDVNAIQRSVMRGLSVPTAVNLPNPALAGIPAEMDKRYPYDLAAARKLLAEAGYPNGFEVTLDCPSNRYVNDEKICTAIAGMLAKIGVTMKVNAIPRSLFFPKMQKHDTSIYLTGWGSASADAIFTLIPVMHSRDEKGSGVSNYGNYKDAGLDALIDSANGEVDMTKRQGMIIEAMKVHHDNILHIPLHLQVTPWASRANVEVVHRADNWLEVRWIKVI